MKANFFFKLIYIKSSNFYYTSVKVSKFIILSLFMEHFKEVQIKSNF